MSQSFNIGLFDVCKLITDCLRGRLFDSGKSGEDDEEKEDEGQAEGKARLTEKFGYGESRV